MIYLDANVFIYAYFKSKKELSEKLLWCKQEAQKIISDLNMEKTQFCISLIQLSEVVNLLKSVMKWEDLQKLIMGLFSNEALLITEVSKMTYMNAVNKISEYEMDSNDISALLLMKELNIQKIYTFDRHFETIPGIVCLPEIPQEFI